MFPILIYSKFSFLDSSCAIYRALNPNFSAIHAAGIYGFFLHSLYAFLIKASVNLFSCATNTPNPNWIIKYKYFMYHGYSYLNHVSRGIKYICSMLHIAYLHDTKTYCQRATYARR